MRILFVASRVPYPPLQGDRVRGYHFLRLLSREHQITLVTPVSRPVDAPTRAVLATVCERWVPVAVPLWWSIANLCRWPFSSLPLQTLYSCPPTIQERVTALLRAESFDVVHVQLARMAPAAASVENVPKVLDFIDALSLNMGRRAVREHPLRRWLFALESRRMAAYERELVASFDRQVVSSPVDKEALGAETSTHVVANGVNLEDFPYTEEGREDGLIVFTGRMAYFPNADAVVYFASRVFPLIRQQVPRARFLIVGADPPGRVRELERIEGVEVTGYVPRLQDFLRRSSVVVAPMRVGSGIQNKVLEAMASGAPVVATPYALGGIEARHEEHLLVANSDGALAEAVLRLFRDRDLARNLARNARRLVEERYTWEAAVAGLENVYEEAIAAHASRGPLAG